MSGEGETEGENEDEEMLPLEKSSDKDFVAYVVKGEMLVLRQELSDQIKDNNTKQQRESIFHTRLHVRNKVCNVIIDAGVTLILLVLS